MADQAYPIEEITQQVLKLLQQTSEGVSEYEFIKTLQKQEIVGFPDVPLSDLLALFKMHYLLHHVLYRLRQQLWQQQQAHLLIDPLATRLLPYQAQQSGIGEYDALSNYYDDLSHIETVKVEEVADLLAQFWQRVNAKDERQDALRVLSLEEPVNYATIKHRYRQLVQQHHPDKGGDKEMLQTLNHALSVLEQYYAPKPVPLAK